MILSPQRALLLFNDSAVVDQKFVTHLLCDLDFAPEDSLSRSKDRKRVILEFPPHEYFPLCPKVSFPVFLLAVVGKILLCSREICLAEV